MASQSVCSTCRFWQKHIHMGVCKRYPLINNKSESDWCGEWAAKPEPVVEVAVKPEEVRVPELTEVIEPKKQRGRPRKEK